MAERPSRPPEESRRSGQSAALPADTQRRRILVIVLVGLAAILIVIVTLVLAFGDLASRLRGTRHESRAVAEGVSVAPFLSLDEPRLFPTGLAAAPDGSLYVSLFGAGAIQHVTPDGEATLFRSVTAPGALVATADGTLYVMDYQAADWRSAGTLQRILPDGETSAFGIGLPADGFPLLAQLTLDGEDNVYVSHPGTGEVWRVTPEGYASLWWRIPPLSGAQAQPTGLAYDRESNALLVADAGTGSVYRLRLEAETPVGELLHRQVGLALHGLSIDEEGRTLLAYWDHDRGVLARLEQDGTLVTLADYFRAPTAVLFRDNRVYVANSDLWGLVNEGSAQPPFTVDVVDVPETVRARTSTPES